MDTKDFSVIEHVMVPEHHVMTREEVEDLLQKYGISYDQLPKIYHDDPAVKTIDGNVNDVIRIVRNSQTAGRAESFRMVVKRPKNKPIEGDLSA